ncbi:MAG: DUF819 family protein [Bacteroidales bacterium]|jgi:uncharacterized membrane protein|nr:DUF819 family protein [Bacteroidales bacterium]
MRIDIILIVAFYFVAPALILSACKKFPLLKKIGSIAVAYIIGILLGLSKLLPDDIYAIQDLLTSITVPLAIPLLLFPSKVKDWFHLAGPTFKSLMVGLFSVLITVSIGYQLFRPEGDPEFWKVGGMLVGVYTGGTPNLASLNVMLDVKPATYLLVHSYDLIIGAFYFLFLITVGQKFFGYFLPAFKKSTTIADENKEQIEEAYDVLFNKKALWPIIKVVGLAILIFAFSGGIAMLFPADYLMIVVILGISTLAILGSLIPGVNKVKESFDVGMYLILVFSIVVASMVDLTNLGTPTFALLGYLSFVIFGSLLLQVIISQFTKTDTDTMIITSTALICSPPFVPVVSGALKNKEILVPGITIGIIGYALGNYLGFLMSELLQHWPF